jgi:RNA polymerase sigma factor (sigma-70 family)
MSDCINIHEDEFLPKLIYKKAMQLSRRPGFTPTDREDLAQALFACVQKQMHRYDAARGRVAAFLKTIVERSAATIARNRDAQKRDPRRECSLNCKYDLQDPVSKEYGSDLPESVRKRRTGEPLRSAIQTAELNLAIQDATAGLSETDQEVCQRLKHSPLAQIARDLNIPRTTLHASVRRIRERFERHGLDSYLGTNVSDQLGRQASSVNEDSIHTNYHSFTSHFRRNARS